MGMQLFSTEMIASLPPPDCAAIMHVCMPCHEGLDCGFSGRVEVVCGYYNRVRSRSYVVPVVYIFCSIHL